MILSVNPQKNIIPIYTEKPEAFRQLSIRDYVNKIKEIKEGESLEL